VVKVERLLEFPYEAGRKLMQMKVLERDGEEIEQGRRSGRWS
jgi:hypothetical protein